MTHNQPKIEVKPSKNQLFLLKLGWFICILHIAFVGFFYTDLPEEIAIHYNAKGVADGFGHKSTIWMLPIIGLAMYAGLFLITTKVKPHLFNYPVKVTEANAEKLYTMSFQLIILLNIIITLLFLILSIEMIGGSMGWFDLNLGWITIAFIATTLLLPFYYIYKMSTIKS